MRTINEQLIELAKVSTKPNTFITVDTPVEVVAEGSEEQEDVEENRAARDHNARVVELQQLGIEKQNIQSIQHRKDVYKRIHNLHKQNKAFHQHQQQNKAASGNWTFVKIVTNKQSKNHRSTVPTTLKCPVDNAEYPFHLFNVAAEKFYAKLFDAPVTEQVKAAQLRSHSRLHADYRRRSMRMDGTEHLLRSTAKWSVEEVWTGLCKMNRGKNAAADGATAEIFQHLGINGEALKKIVIWFQKIFDNEVEYPTEWAISQTAMIPKADNPTNITQFRPITNLPPLAKLYHKILHQRLQQHLQKQAWHTNQTCGAPDRQAASMLTALQHTIEKHGMGV
jgi:hypothetical protein